VSVRRLQVEAKRTAATLRSRLAEDLLRLSSDAGVSARQLAAESGLSHVFVARTLRGETRPTIESYAKLAAALGADLATRLYPNTGPAIRDRHQAQILEWLLEQLHPRWRPFTEVRVHWPARGWIDVVLHDRRAATLIATEIQSELRRLEQLVRWSHEKASALPSWEGWPELDEEPTVSRLLIVRRTRATRAAASAFARQLALAYPAHPDDAVAALTGTASWPGAALVWVRLEAGGLRFVAGR
jgi:transcriptional regulator with XRE-family HTH domain